MSLVTAMMYGHCSVLCQKGFVGDHPDRMGPGDPEMPHLSRIRPAILEKAGVETFAVGTALEELKCRTALFMT